MSDHMNQVTVRWYTEETMRATEAGARLMREQEPRGGDFIVIRCHPSRTRTIEAALRSQLAPFGAGSGVDDER